MSLEVVPIDEKASGFTHFAGQELLSPADAQKVARFRPHLQQTGGFFIAKLRKLASIPSEKKLDTRTLKTQQREHSAELQKKVWDFLYEHWEIPQQSAFHFFASSQAIYATHQDFSKLSSSLFIEKS